MRMAVGLTLTALEAGAGSLKREQDGIKAEDGEIIRCSRPGRHASRHAPISGHPQHCTALRSTTLHSSAQPDCHSWTGGHLQAQGCHHPL